MALGDGDAWDETTPNNGTFVSDGDDHIRDVRKGLRIRLEYEHSTMGGSSAGGKHKFVTLQTQASKPTIDATQVAAVYIKDVAGVKELFYEDSNAAEVQLTTNGAINVAATPAFSAGMMLDWGGTSATIPTGWLLCDGTAVSRATYATLFAAIASTWGSGDGSTTFNLPDTLYRFPLGAKDGGTVVSGNMGPTSTTSPTLAGSGNDVYLRVKSGSGEGAFQPGSSSGDSASRDTHQHSYMPRYYGCPKIIKT